MGREIKIRLEKPAVNISKFTGGKNEKARRGGLHKKLRLDLYFVYRKYYMEIKITEYVVCQQEAFYITNRSNLSRSFYCFLIHIQSSF